MSVQLILQQLKEGKFDVNEAGKAIEALSISKEITYKVSTKGCVSFYGIRRMPITLYIGELEKIVEKYNSEEFKVFLAENEKNLARK